MSFIITVYVSEGIVLASDSRLTLISTSQIGTNTYINTAVSKTDSVYKTFLTEKNIGISTCGDGSIRGVPIAGFIQSFIADEVNGEDITIAGIATKLVDYFRQLDPNLNTNFVVAGYENHEKTRNQVIYQASVKNNTVHHINKNDEHGAHWSGEIDIFYRLLKPMWTYDEVTATYTKLDQYEIQFAYFTLQDAIDFAVFAMRTTIDGMRFQVRNKTVGGPIDVLVIKPEGGFWMSQKELSVKL